MKEQENSTMEKHNRLYQLTTYAIMCALMCIFGPISVPIGPIPISLTILIICLSIYIIGLRGTLISYLVYLLLGIVGLPVFSGYQGGLSKLAGPTGGYLFGFVFLIFISGLFYERTNHDTKWTIVGMILGIAVDYAFGTAWFILQMHCSLPYAISVCVFPFILFDIGKVIISTILGKAVRKPLSKQGLV